MGTSYGCLPAMPHIASGHAQRNRDICWWRGGETQEVHAIIGGVVVAGGRQDRSFHQKSPTVPNLPLHLPNLHPTQEEKHN